MSTMTVTTKITHKYLMGKTKNDLSSLIFFLLDKIDKIDSDDKELFKKTEWVQDEFTGVTGGRCPVCGGYKNGMVGGFSVLHVGEFEGHKPDCLLFLAMERQV